MERNDIRLIEITNPNTKDSISQNEPTFEDANIPNGAEGILTDLSSDNIFGIVSVISSVRRKIKSAQNSSVENFWSNNNRVQVENNNGIVTISNINARALFRRIEERYSENVMKIFDINYHPGDLKRYLRKRITSKKKMRIQSLTFNEFFAIEVVNLFERLKDAYNVPSYSKVITELVNNTYLSNFVQIERYATPISSLVAKEFEKNPPLNHQQEFIELYPYLKRALSLRGFLLSFDQGLGKTMTSLVLGHNLNKEQFIIVCPNTLTSVWADEIVDKCKKYQENPQLAKEDIYVHDDKTRRYHNTLNPRYIIVNNEAVNKIGDKINYRKNTIVIIDECQNFRYLSGQRWGFLINMINTFYKKNQSFDVLAMSGTPIKAKPSEISPVLMMIDPKFNEACAKIYAAAFDVDSVNASEIVNHRFSQIMYRRTKAEVLNLPPKYQSVVNFKVSDPSRFLLETVKYEVRTRFGELYYEKLQAVAQYAPEYEAYVHKYCDKSCPNSLKVRFLEWLRTTLIKRKYVELHELDMEEYLTFVDRYVKPNITDREELMKFKVLESKYSHARNSAMGLAIGEILPKRRDEMFITMIRENESAIMDLIDSAEKKVALFTSSRKVVTELEEFCKRNGLGYVSITGDNPKERAELLERFKYDDDVEILIGTNRTLGVGITITCANVEIIFGPPWRKADYDQLTDRIYRIGQTSPCYIYNVELSSDGPNLSTRMNEIMDWSGAMTDQYIENARVFTEGHLGIEDSILVGMSKGDNMDIKIGNEMIPVSEDGKVILEGVKTANEEFYNEVFGSNDENSNGSQYQVINFEDGTSGLIKVE